MFLFVDLFDNVGTLVGVGKHAGLFDADNRIPRIGRILLTDATATVVGAVPTAATAPALIVVGSLMMAHLTEIAWGDPAIAIPAFLTLITIPLTFSIANGLAFGFTSYAVLRVVAVNSARPIGWFTCWRRCLSCVLFTWGQVNQMLTARQ